MKFALYGLYVINFAPDLALAVHQARLVRTRSYVSCRSARDTAGRRSDEATTILVQTIAV
jgi:hypothetical protein